MRSQSARLFVSALAITVISAATGWAQRPSTDRHVDELAACLDRVQIAEPLSHQTLSVYPILLDGGDRLRGRWLTLDDAIARGSLVVREKQDASVPVISVENRSRDHHVFLMKGEIVAGGKQTRTLRGDAVIAPGQSVELSVFCVEAHRWKGDDRFAAGKLLVPQSIQQELRRGADQQRIWAEIARNNEALSVENPTGSLEKAMKDGGVQERLERVRKAIVPRIPAGTMGFIFVDRGRALGVELFGNEDLARSLFPKLLDSYAVDCLLLTREADEKRAQAEHRPAVDFFERVCRAGSERTATEGSGAGIRTRAQGLLGDGVSFERALVHFGVQAETRIVPMPRPRSEPAG
jgi:hypothetical protein